MRDSPQIKAGQLGVLVGGMVFYAVALSWLSWNSIRGGPYERTVAVVVGTLLALIACVVGYALWTIWLTGRRGTRERIWRKPGRGVFEETGHEVLLRPLVRTGWRWCAVVLFLLGIVGWGAYAYFTQLRTGLGVTGLRFPYFWGVYLANFVFFIGISHAGTLISAILRVTKAEWRRPVTRAAEAITVFALVIGAPQILLDLGRIDRLMNVLQHGRFQSPILWDVCCISVYMVGSLTYLWLPLIPDLALVRDRLPRNAWLRRIFYGTTSIGWRGTERQKHALERAIGFMMIVIIPVAVSVHTVVSWIFGMTVQPMWHSTILGPYFVIGAIFSGIASLLIAMAILRKAYHLENYFQPVHFNNLAVLMIAMILLWAYATLAEYLTTFYGSEPAHMSVFYAKVKGEYAPVFWTMVACCFAIPLPILAIRKTRTIAGIVVASVSISIGMWLERFTIVVPTLSHPRLPYRVMLYSPSWVEWSVTAASFAMMALLYALFVKVFPVVSIWEISEGKEKEPESALAPPAIPTSRGREPVALRGLTSVGASRYLTTARDWTRKAVRARIRPH